jgi:hypothetical protein
MSLVTNEEPAPLVATSSAWGAERIVRGDGDHGYSLWAGNREVAELSISSSRSLAEADAIIGLITAAPELRVALTAAMNALARASDVSSWEWLL